MHCTESEIQLIQIPSSVLVPVNKEALFTCEAHCSQLCDILWINATTHDVINKPGTVSSQQDHENYEYVSTLALNASVEVNNTQLYCFVILDGEDDIVNRSVNATLLVIPGRNTARYFFS